MFFLFYGTNSGIFFRCISHELLSTNSLIFLDHQNCLLHYITTLYLPWIYWSRETWNSIIIFNEINFERAFIFLLERRRGDARRLFVLNFFPIGQINSGTPLLSCTSIEPFILGNWPATLRCQNNSSDLENCGDDPIPLTYKLKQV